jgi:hypothetical protein
MKFHFKREVRSKKQEARSLAAGHPSSLHRAPSSFLLQPSQKGVALIITVILLAALTLMILAFLTLSQRERGAVTTTTDTASARLAADAALANAEAQILANVLATTNPYNFSLLVSTNYINPYGFQIGVASLTNVNYYYHSGGPVSANDFPQLLANLYYLPRAPVLISSNDPVQGRFYLDLNRNRKFDTNGIVGDFDNGGAWLGDISEVGDPEWIGVLQRPDQPYGPNNPFVARFAFVAVPIGNALDLNAIHNQVRSFALNPVNDGYFRNEGVGSWEINLAAFLADLNTNSWDSTLSGGVYQYLQPAFANNGAAFNDALSLLSYRYGDYYGSLQPLPPANFYSALVNNGIDGYTYGNPMTGLELPLVNAPPPFNGGTPPWAGADNTNHFFTHQELFDPNKTSGGPPPAQTGFTNRLLNADNSPSTYDRYTFYRLLSQLGTDSTPESGKMNLNYSNAVAYFTNGIVTNITIIPGAETNFTAWTPVQFFTIAADKMLRAYTGLWRNSNPTNFATTFYAVTNFSPMVLNPSLWTNYPAFGLSGAPGVIPGIPVLVSNQFVYTPAIQRVLQLAANIYDATANSFYPSVFRPIFEHDNLGNVFIVGYTNLSSASGPNTVTGTGDFQLALPHDVADLANFPLSFTPITDASGYVNVYGVPWIIGAKKGFPNFNEFSLESIVGITRRLQFTRLTTNLPPPNSVNPSNFHTNQMYTMCISNLLGVECWNSYNSNYLDNVSIALSDNVTSILNVYDGISLPFSISFSTNFATLTNVIAWPGSAPWSAGYPTNISFVIPLNANLVMPLGSATAFTNWWVYSFLSHQFVPAPSTPLFEDVPGFPVPHFTLMTTNRLRVVMLDRDTSGNYHVIDYVHFAGPDSTRDLNAEIFNDDPDGVWNTNAFTTGVPVGIRNQIQISEWTTTFPAGPPSEDGTWHGDAEAQSFGPCGATTPSQQAFFGGFFRAGNYWTALGWGGEAGCTATNLVFGSVGVEAPYEPTRYVVLYTTWQANDPLVHYIASDLNYTEETGTPHPGINVFNYGTTITNLPDLGALNDHYMPWGGHLPINTNAPDFNTLNAYNMALKDPLMWQSDDWDFPMNKFPTVGWLGRVHRGTPWQTVYMKSPAVSLNTWTNWTGDFNTFDANNSLPAQDRLLFDLFTTAFNDNATRGTLSVNVGATNGPSLAAWSALFSGIVVPINTNGGFTVIQPAGVYAQANPPPLVQIVQGINQTRTNFVNADGLIGSFEHVGDILAVPQLSVQSPFLSYVDPAVGTNDEMYEWLPQQTMSLLRCSSSPRYVIYSYGQALKPAPNSVYTGSGSLFGMVTNYQIVSEAATRAVVRFNSIVTNVVTYATDNLTYTNWFSVPVVTNNNVVIERFNVLPPD